MGRMKAQTAPERLTGMERRHQRERNESYERGWAEGWNACLARVQQDGLEKVLEREWLLPPETLSLSAPPAADAADDEDEARDSEQDQHDSR